MSPLPLVGSWWNLSPAFLILWIPGGFRATCYYYRKAYYRSFFGSPPACAVRDWPKRYLGETRFPFVLQNLHRYFFWLSLPILAFLCGTPSSPSTSAGASAWALGTLVLIINARSCRCTRSPATPAAICAAAISTCSRARPGKYSLWQVVTRLNERHMLFAWISLVWVGLTDLYVRLLSMGVIRDLRFL